MNRIDLEKSMRQLVDANRASCLWFLREDYYPTEPEEMLRALGHIMRHGDLQAYKQAGEIRQWLLMNSNNPSAGYSH